MPEQADYVLGWTEAIARTDYKPGVYTSGLPVSDGAGPDGKPTTITTIQDIRARVAAAHLHEVAFWVYQDACPPAPGCVVNPAHAPTPISAAPWTPVPGSSPSRRGVGPLRRPAAQPTTATATATRQA